MSLQVQFLTLGMMLCSGWLLGSLFDTIRIVTTQMRLSRWFLHLVDVLFGLVSALLVFRLLYISNSGEIRLFVFIGLIIGIMTYFIWLSRSVVKVIEFLLECVKKCYRFVIWLLNGMIVRPLIGLYKLLLALIGMIVAISIFFYKIMIQCLYPFWKGLLWVIKLTRLDLQWIRRWINRVISKWKR